MELKYGDIVGNKEFINQVQATQEVVNMANNLAIQDAIRVTSSPVIQSTPQIADIVARNINPIDITSEFSRLIEKVANCCKILVPENFNNYFKQMSNYIHEMVQQVMPLYSPEQLINTANVIRGIAENYSLMYCHSDDIPDEDVAENEEINNKIVTEIFKKDEEINRITDENESSIITLSPINDRVLKYLSENPEVLYQLQDRDFEVVMAEIYSKLGYKVELTKATRDGGKDIIIRKPEILGDFVYYVECKKYAAKRHIGIGIIKSLVGTVSADRVNGGILATTSYFTPDAKRFIVDNKYSYQIQMHDYDVIRKLLDKVV